MSGEAYRRRLRRVLTAANVRRPGDVAAFETALTHQSYAKEHGTQSNERMEFLGDSILGCITAEWLYARFDGEPEGLLTLRRAAIVNDSQLARSAQRLGFPALIKLGAGMQSAGGSENTSILADAFEAFVAALYLRYGMETARRFIVDAHIEHLDHSAEALLDAKTRLQHFAQEHLRATPTYREISRGTPQQPAFKSRVSVNGRIVGRGDGPSKKSAQQAAAAAALLSLLESPAG